MLWLFPGVCLVMYDVAGSVSIFRDESASVFCIGVTIQPSPDMTLLADSSRSPLVVFSASSVFHPHTNSQTRYTNTDTYKYFTDKKTNKPSKTNIQIKIKK